MVDRRTTLLGLAAACGAGLSRTTLGRPPATAGAPPPAATPAHTPPGDAIDPAMREDLARMGSHEYSDEGIPVLLACVDLVAEYDGKAAVPIPAFSRQFAANLRRYGDAWQHLHPDAKDTDISKVIEVLAERDFAAAAKTGAQ